MSITTSGRIDGLLGFVVVVVRVLVVVVVIAVIVDVTVGIILNRLGLVGPTSCCILSPVFTRFFSPRLRLSALPVT